MGDLCDWKCTWGLCAIGWNCEVPMRRTHCEDHHTLWRHNARPQCTVGPTQVCDRTETDKKGGHLARRKADGRLMLRESAMCPDADKDAFEDITKYE